MSTPIICVSIGDYNGIGAEVILKSLARSSIAHHAVIILIGHSSIIDYYAANTGVFVHYQNLVSLEKLPSEPGIYSWNVANSAPKIIPGDINKDAGCLSMQSVYTGLKLCLQNKAHALVTAPISKEAIQLAGYDVPGHTEFLARHCNVEDYVMMLVQKDSLRVGLITIHEPVSQIAGLISKDKILKTVQVVHKSLRDDFDIAEPKIAILGLNPHAGDGGVIGTEEIDIILPAITELQKRGLQCKGPYPADGFFGSRSYQKFDAVIAMYHDQGLIPFKTICFNGGVNFTAGLPIIRTSPDHGTAYGIAGKNKAEPASFMEALELAGKLAKKKL